MTLLFWEERRNTFFKTFAAGALVAAFAVAGFSFDDGSATEWVRENSTLVTVGSSLAVVLYGCFLAFRWWEYRSAHSDFQNLQAGHRY